MVSGIYRLRSTVTVSASARSGMDTSPATVDVFRQVLDHHIQHAFITRLLGCIFSKRNTGVPRYRLSG